MANQKAFSEIRHEVYKFGLQGLDKKVQVNARYEQAIKLGAKPKSWIRPHINKADQNQLERNNRQQDKQLEDDNHRYQQLKQQKPRKKQKQKQTTKQTHKVKRKSKTSKS